MTTSQKRLYRFRPLQVLSTKSVVDEIRARELYLGTLEDNNDPMDGMLDAYWEGDNILWANLIRHYCFCLLNAASIVSVAGDSIAFGVNDITARATPDDWPDAPIRQLFQDFLAGVNADKKIAGLLPLLTEKRRLAKDELRLLLGTYHPQFLSVLRDTLSKNGRVEFLRGLNLKAPPIALAPFEASVKQADTRLLSALAGAAEHASRQMQLITMYEHGHHGLQQGTAKRNLLTLLSGFPALYLDACTKGIYDEYYIACFTERNDNESMWGHYASGHRGICLIFEFEEREGRVQMELEEQGHLDLYEVQYSPAPPQVNVFESLGYLPANALHRNWLSCGEQVSQQAHTYSSPDYHSTYWQAFAQTVSHKFPEWEREREYRVVKSAWFSGRKPASERLMHYREKHLKGVIFGMRTPVDQQLEIMAALDATLSDSQKKGFEFHSARYCSARKTLEVTRLDLIKFA
ncbi:DUF2971 domain-containing protein [Paraburkholderia agricolaris]|uniref:DUF2971 domain-containing protein n=1 Tax=Paraburkholderia agricolaris TaxID=2152888 RepID=A0ABW8ZQC8_9BURK